MFDTTTKIAGAALVGIFVIAGCGAQSFVDPAGTAPETPPSATPTPEISEVVSANRCELLTDGEVSLVLGTGVAAVDSPLPGGGHWCAWRPTGAPSITQLALSTASGEDLFDEAMGRAERGGGLHDTDPALGELGFTTDDGQNRAVAWVIDDISVVLTLTGGDTSVDDLVVLAKAIDARLRA